jgi:hypothetical protein
MDLFDPGQVQTPPKSLVNGCGVGKPVTQDGFALPEGGSDYLTVMLNPVGHVEEEFGHGLHAGIVGRKENPPDLFTYSGSARLPGEQERTFVLYKKRFQVTDLGGLAASLDPLEGYENTQVSPNVQINLFYSKKILLANH